MIKKVKEIAESEITDKKSQLVSDTEIKQTLIKKKNQYYNTLWSGIVFEEKEQTDGGIKIISKLPSGKYIFLDKSEDTSNIKLGIPYICLIYEPVNEKTGKEISVAFAKIVTEESIPKILVTPDGMIYLIYKDSKGKSKKEMLTGQNFGYRIIDAVNKFSDMGVEEARIVFVKNKAKEAKKVKNEK